MIPAAIKTRLSRRAAARDAAPADEDAQTVGVGAVAPLAGQSHPWALRQVIDHVTVSGAPNRARLIAWFVADSQPWSFKSNADGNAAIAADAETLAQLVGTSVHVRVTTRPYPVSSWARACWDNAVDPQPGFDAVMEADQIHLATSAQVDKLVFMGVEVGARGRVLSTLAKMNAGVADRETNSIRSRLAHIEHIMSTGGYAARPATPDEMEWVIARSIALGCPVPVSDPDAPTPELDSDGIAAMASTVQWCAEPLDPTVQITTSMGERQETRHVVVLTMGRCDELAIPESDTPWMSRTDALPFAVEWYARIDVRPGEDVQKDMATLSNRVDAQVNHWSREHGKRPPKQLARQSARISEIEDEMRSGFTGMHTRTRSWFRCAVSGRTADEALDRAEQVKNLYKPRMQMQRELGQYALAREFVPGEPLSSTAHVRRWPVMKVAAGMPEITSEVGDKRGFHIGETAGLSSRAVFHDPWYLTEVMETSGLITINGGLGSGKTILMSHILRKAILSGAVGVALDPSSRLRKMLRLPELVNISQSISVLGGEAGSLSPYGVIAPPNRELLRLDLDDPNDEDALDEAVRIADIAARAKRRDLCYESLRWCLPVTVSRHDEALNVLRSAVAKCPDDEWSTAVSVIDRLHQGDEKSRELAVLLEEARGREKGRLFFAEDRSDTHEPLYDSSARLTAFNLQGLHLPDPEEPLEQLDADDLLARPIMGLTAWASLSLIYRHDPNQRKIMTVDEAHEIIETSTAGRALVTKISTDSRKNNLAAYLAMHNAGKIVDAGIANYAGASFIGRTRDEDAQRDALRLLGKPAGKGYEQILAGLSRQRRDSGGLSYREFVFADGLGGEDGRGGMEIIRARFEHHTDAFEATTTTSDGKRARALEG